METPTKKQKILYIITKSNWGGAQRHVFDLATNMPSDKFEVVVAAGGNGILHEKLKAVGIKTISIPILQRDPHVIKDTASITTIFKIIKSERPDILHLHSTKVGGIGAFLGRFYNLSRRFIYFFHSLFSHFLKLSTFDFQLLTIVYTAHGWAFKEDRSGFQKIVISFYSWLTVILSNQTIVVSEEDFLKSPRFLIKNKVVLIHNGIKSFETIARAEAQRQVFGEEPILPNNLLVGCIAELHKNKGLSYAVQAISDIKKQEADKDRPILFSVISDGEERANLTAQIEKASLTKTVFLPGQKENAKELLSAFDLFLLPSLKEGLPYVLLEAGNAGLPVIATDVGGAKDIITDMETGILIRPADVKEISNALKFFIQNPEKITEFGGKLKKRISEEFSLQKMLTNTIAVYEN